MPHGIDAVLLDLVGVLVDGSGPIPGALEASVRLRAAGIPFRIVTNLSRISAAEISRRLDGLGFSIDPEEIWNPPRLASERLRRLAVDWDADVAPGCLDTGPTRPLDNPGACVVVFGDGAGPLAPGRRRVLATIIEAGADVWLLAARADPPVLGLEPLDGFAERLELAAAGRPELIGKPAAGLFRAACADLGLPEGSVVAMVGDDIAVDLIGASRVGLRTVYLPGGATTAGEATAATFQPDRTEADLGTFVHRWLRIR